jgi:hypothetical protein
MLAVQAAGGLPGFIQGASIITGSRGMGGRAQALLERHPAGQPDRRGHHRHHALVAGIILLYRHNETFRKIVQAVWAAIKTAVGDRRLDRRHRVAGHQGGVGRDRGGRRCGSGTT